MYRALTSAFYNVVDVHSEVLQMSASNGMTNKSLLWGKGLLYLSNGRFLGPQISSLFLKDHQG